MLQVDKEMLRSCFAYHELYGRHYNEIVDKYGQEAVDAEIKFLEDNFTIAHNVHTDLEGCTYNCLISKAWYAPK